MKNHLIIILLAFFGINISLAPTAFGKESKASAPAAPGGFKTLFTGPSLISLSWNDNSSNETSFEIEQSSSPDFAPIQVRYRISQNSTRYTVNNLKPDSAYYFRVRAENDAGSSNPTPGLSVRTLKTGIFPLSIHDGTLHTHTGEPFLIIGDSPWSLIVGPDMEGVEKYLVDRKNRGVNSLIMNLVESYYNGPEDAYGNRPFLTPGDFTTPNPDYFNNVDFVIGKALENGIEVFLNPAYLGYDDGHDHMEGWYNSIIRNGPDKMYWWGRYVGSRYKDYKNIVWVMGGDCAPKNALAEIRAVVKGIEETAGPQIFTVHNGRFHSGITEYPGEKWIDLNTTYADKSTTASHLMNDYKLGLPFFYIEGTYEQNDISDEGLRSQMYLPALMGASGYFYGNASLFKFSTGWEDSSVMESQGSGDMQRFAGLFNSRSWYHLNPDVNHTLLTAGAGDLQGGKYATAAITDDSTTAVIYVPEYRKLTVDLTRITGSRTHVWWFRPSNGETFDGSNIVGELSAYSVTPPFESDWVLILDDAGRGYSKPRTKNEEIDHPERENLKILKNADSGDPVTNGFIYPNPARYEFHITESISDNAEITIFDLQRKTMLSGRVINNTVDISSLPEGLYIVELRDLDRILVTKLVKE